MSEQSSLTNLCLLVAKWTAKGAALGVWSDLLGLGFASQTSSKLGLSGWLGDNRLHAAVGGAAIFGWVGFCVALSLMAAGCRRWDRTVEASLRAPLDIQTLAFDWGALFVLLPLVAWLGMGPVLFTVSSVLVVLSICAFIKLSLSGPIEAMRIATTNHNPLLFLGRGLIELTGSLVIFVVWLLLTVQLFHINLVSWIMFPIGIVLFMVSLLVVGSLAESGALETNIIGVFLLPLRGIFSLSRQVIVVTAQTVNPIAAVIIFCVGMFVAVSLISTFVNFIIISAQPVNSIIAVAAPMVILTYAIDGISVAFGSSVVDLADEKSNSSYENFGRFASIIAYAIAVFSLLPLLSVFFRVESIEMRETPPVLAPKQEVELLHNTPTVVSVSSLAHSLKFSPKSMLDGDFETAWNSQSGDLIGTRISFDIPAAAHVNTIKLTAGFTGSNKKGDLFVMNHRLRKIALALNGSPIGEFVLDPGNRTLQTLPINRGGGKYTIEVLETLPGSRANWREVCISEMEVWGYLPPNEQPRKQMPRIQLH